MKEKSPLSKPQTSSQFAQKELDKAEQQFDKFQNDVQAMTLDRLNEAPKIDAEQQTKISNREAQKSDVWLKPKKALGPGVDPKTGKREQFNENFRSDYNFQKEYVQFIAENKEIIGEKINLWTKPFPGMDCEEWDVPVNKAVWGPRYLAEQIKRCNYHRLTMQDKVSVGSDYAGTYQGTMVADGIIQRLDAHPVNQRKSLFMGASGF